MKSPHANHLVALGAGLVALAIYVVTLTPDMLPGDSGEFQFAVPILGIVHPTGYPLYLLSAKLLTLLPIGSPAFRVNLFSAVCGAAAIGAFYLLVERSLRGVSTTKGARRGLALASAAVLAFTPTFWSQATRAEVYALNTLFVVGLWYVAVRLAEGRGATSASNDDEATKVATTRRAASGGKAIEVATTGRGSFVVWGALMFGLSLAHHRTTLLLVPAMIAALWNVRLDGRTWLRAGALALLPLTLYLYTPLRYDASPYTRMVLDDAHVITTLEGTPEAFLGHMLGTGFGGELRWGDAGPQRLANTPARIADEFGGVPGWATLAAAVGGLLYMARVARRQAAVVALSVGASIGFNALYQIGDIAAYFTPVYAAIAWLAAWGGAWLAARQARSAAPFAFAAGSALCLWLAATGFANLEVDPGVRTWATGVLKAAPPDAILISNDRDEMTPLYYAQLVDGVRRDAAVLFPRISPELGHVVPLTKYALETRRPVLFVKEMAELETVFRLERADTLVRVTGEAESTPERAMIVESDAVQLRGWSGRFDRNEAEVVLFWQAAGAARDDFATYVHLLDASGAVIAQSDHVPGGAYYPPSQWRRAERIRDVHRMRLSGGAPGSARIVAGAYGTEGVAGVRHVEAGRVGAGE